MLRIRHSSERGQADHGWLKARHSFSFGDYYDPANMGFSVLRVINEDVVAPGTGFGMHGHRDMEIITYILEGELRHADSMGNGAVIRRNEVQVMTAGSGVRHSEVNPSSTQPVHLLQIWITPGERDLTPAYAQKLFDPVAQRGRLQLLAAPEGSEGSLVIHQDARVYAALLDGDETLAIALRPERKGYLHVAAGSLLVQDMLLQAGDALEVSDETRLDLKGGHAAEFLFFDLP